MIDYILSFRRKKKGEGGKLFYKSYLQSFLR